MSAEPGTTCERHDVYIDAMWWDREGAVHVYFQGDEEHPGPEDGQRRLEGGSCVESGAAPATEERRLNTAATVIRDDWTLSVEIGGERTKIDADVRYVTAAPY